jgi:hypothetical protein
MIFFHKDKEIYNKPPTGRAEVRESEPAHAVQPEAYREVTEKNTGKNTGEQRTGQRGRILNRLSGSFLRELLFWKEKKHIFAPCEKTIINNKCNNINIRFKCKTKDL